MSKLDRLNELEAKKQSVLQGGGESAVKKQTDAGKLTARQRISKLLDDKSFIETDAFAEFSAAVEGFETVSAAGEGVVTGYGTINSRPVYVFSQDFTVLSGSLGYMHTTKILKVLSMAGKAGVPVIAMLDSAGARLGEGAAALNGLARIMKKMTNLSGVVPMISVVAGPCVGCASYLTSLSDFVFTTDSVSGIFNSAPSLFGDNKEKVGGAMATCESGVADFYAENEDTCFAQVKSLMEFLPFNNVEDAPYSDQTDDINKQLSDLNTMEQFDAKASIAAIADNAVFMETKAYYSPNVVTGFGRLNGFVVGFVANNGDLSAKAAKKAAEFVSFCDAFNTPLVTLVDTAGYPVSECACEVEDGAKLIYAYAESSVPMVTVICGKAIGAGFVSMGSKGLGADMVYAWPDAVISSLELETAGNIIMTDEVIASDNPIEKRKELGSIYAEKFANPFEAAKQGAVDDIIAPAETRQRVIAALEMCFGKRESTMPKKHGVMPL